MPPYEIHNEDAHYSRLAIGFLLNNDEQQLLLSFTDPELEPLLFPDLFSTIVTYTTIHPPTIITF